ncbi:TonB-dependent receptor [Mucilaginibacter sp. RCC_168]|uniref:TonB-dependent receptor domain-containing protein n=1 Tax=Mucilaginibacter sp. RCC_168 TaxID=3239221 RepID=UPI003526A403
MKTLILNILAILLMQNAFGQISGKLVTTDGKPLMFANVSLLKVADTSVVQSTQTNADGIYRIENVPAGNYKLRLSSVGYQTWDSPGFEIKSRSAHKDLGTTMMQESTRQLGEVVVRASKPLYQQRPDGMVVNVESSLMTKGSSALQVLERSPGVIIDHRNNNINLNGKGGVMVMMDGKLMRMPMDQVVNMLSGMSASNIEKIELLSTPPAGYDAEGSAGIINIVTQKNKKQGTNGSFSATGGYGLGEKGMASLNLAHNTKNVNLYGAYTFSHDRTYTDLFITSSQNMPFLGGDVAVVFDSYAKRVQNDHNANVGADIKLNTKTTLSGNLTYNTSSAALTTTNHAGYNVLPDSLLTYNGLNTSQNRWNNLVSSISIDRQINTNDKISFDADYIYYHNDNPSQVQTTFVNKHGQVAGTNDSLNSPQQRGFAATTIKVGVAKVDYTKQLNPKLKLETGIKGTYTTSSSSSGLESLLDNTWVKRTESANEIYMKEGIGAAYASFNAEITPSTKLTVGARYEYSYTDMTDPNTGKSLVNRKLGVLFPTILFSKKLNENAELQLSYSKRISRPTYNDLASYVGYSDPTAVYTGNPFLKPTITNNIKLGYNYRDYSFSLLYSRDDNPIARYQLSTGPSKDLLYISPQNLSYQNNLTLQANLPFKVSNWWDMTYSFTGGLSQFKGGGYSAFPFRKSYFIYTFNFNESFKLPKKYSFELSGWYNSQWYNGTTKINGLGSLNAGIKKELNNNGGSFQLSVADILRSIRVHVYYGTLTQEPFNIKSYVDVHTESSKFPIIKLTYSKSFGSTRASGQAKQTTGDERDRLRKD